MIRPAVAVAFREQLVERLVLDLRDGIPYRHVDRADRDRAFTVAAGLLAGHHHLPGTVGIEVPNAHKKIVTLRDVLEDKKFSDNQSKLTLAIGPYRRAIELLPYEFEYRYNLGTVYQSLDRNSEAAETYEGAAELRPRSVP